MAGFQPVLRGGRAPTVTQLHGANGVRRQQRFRRLVGGSSEAVRPDAHGIRCCRSYCLRRNAGRSTGFPIPDDFVPRDNEIRIRQVANVLIIAPRDALWSGALMWQTHLPVTIFIAMVDMKLPGFGW